jgi:hypothetical protein
MPKSPHALYPLRRIVRGELQDGKPHVLLACGHAMPGTPANGRHSKFYPCATCHEVVKAYRRKTS